MNLGDILLKVADNRDLTSGERDFLRLEGNRTQNMNSLTAGFTKAGTTRLDVKFPIDILYSDVFAVDQASVSVDVPSDYRHLFIIGGGRTTQAVYNSTIEMQFNGDTGANYRGISDGAQNTTQIATQSTGLTFIVLGEFSGTSAAAGIASGFFSFVPHIQGQLWKSVFALRGNPKYDATDLLVLLGAQHWESVSPITSLSIFPGSGNFLAGSSISIYGIR